MADYTLSAKITGDSSGFSKACTNAQKTLAKLQDNFKNIGSKIQNLGDRLTSSITKPALAAGTALAGITLGKGFTRLTAIDTAKAKLEGLGNSAESVTDIMTSANAAVKGTSYGLDEAATTAASAVAAGIKPGQELTRYLTLTGDAAATSGRSMSEMGAIFNKVQTSQAAYTEDLNQLADSGIPIYQWLGEEAGISAAKVKEMASEGKISSEMFLDAIEQNIGGAAKIVGENSFTGALSNIGASIGRIGANFLDANGSGQGFFTQLKPLMVEFKDWLGTLEEKAATWGQVFGEAFSGVVEYIKTGNVEIGGFTEQAQNIVTTLQPIIDVVKNVISVFSSLSPTMQAGLAGGIVAAGPLISILGKIFSASGSIIGVIGKMAPLFGALCSPIGLVVAAIAALAAGFGYLIATDESFRSGILSSFSEIGQTCMPIITEMANTLKNFGSAVLPMIIDIAKQIAGVIMNVVSSLLPTLLGLIQSLLPIITSVLTTAFSLLQQIMPIISQFISSLLPAITPILQTIMSALSQLALTLLPAITQIFQALMPIVSTALNLIINLLSQIMPVLSNLVAMILPVIVDLINQLMPFVTQLVDMVAQLFAALAPMIEQLVNALLPVITNIIECVMQLVSQIMPPLITIINTIMSVIQALMPVITNIVSVVVDVVSSIISAISPIIDAITNIISTVIEIISPIIEFIAGVISTIMEYISPIIEFITNVVGTIFKVISNIIGKISSAISTAVNVISKVIGTIQKVFSTIFKAVFNIVKGVMDKVSGVFKTVIGAIQNAWNGLTDFVGGIFDGIKSAFDTVINAVKGAINFVIDGINGAIGLINLIPGVEIEPIQHLAHGTDDWQGGFAYMNEGGRGELVHLPNGAQVIPHDISVTYAKEAARANASGNLTIDYDYLINGIAAAMSNVNVRHTTTMDGKVVSDATTPLVDNNLAVSAMLERRFA